LSEHTGSKIIVTGHSLGGSLAILAAADLAKTHGKIEQVYTFGQPRVGNAAFASHYQSLVSNTFRLIDFADIVPHVPPSAFGFQHSSQ
jgi:predicted lipase